MTEQASPTGIESQSDNEAARAVRQHPRARPTPMGGVDMTEGTSPTHESAAFNGAPPLPLGRAVLPFNDLVPDRQDHIRWAVTQPKPPERWLALSGGLVRIESRAWYEWHWHRCIDTTKRRSRLPDWLRRYVIERDGLNCKLCGDVVDSDDVHIDHIRPVALGGTDDADNLQVSHSSCNVRKGAAWVATSQGVTDLQERAAELMREQPG